MFHTKEIKILLVDDEPHILQYLVMGQQNEGFQVFTASDGLSTVSVAQEVSPHVVVLDVLMPGMDGFEVCKMTKKEGSAYTRTIRTIRVARYRVNVA